MVVIFAIVIVYMLAIGACGYFEYNLRLLVETTTEVKNVILSICVEATVGRMLLVAFLACGCAIAVCKLKPNETKD